MTSTIIVIILLALLLVPLVGMQVVGWWFAITERDWFGIACLSWLAAIEILLLTGILLKGKGL